MPVLPPATRGTLLPGGVVADAGAVVAVVLGARRPWTSTPPGPAATAIDPEDGPGPTSPVTTRDDHHRHVASHAPLAGPVP